MAIILSDARDSRAPNAKFARAALAERFALSSVLQASFVFLTLLGAFLPCSPAAAQVSTPATPRVGTPTAQTEAPSHAAPLASSVPSLVPRAGPLPANLTLEQALAEADARSPAVAAAQAEVAAAQGRLRQAGFRPNPELSVQVENFLGTGEVSGVRGAEVTVAVNQRLDLSGRRAARRGSAQGELRAAQLRLLIARADLAQAVRQQFAVAVAARDRLAVAVENDARSRELARIAGVLVEAGREPPLRALRARSAAIQAAAALQAAQAAEAASRRSLASLFGVEEPPAAVAGALGSAPPLSLAADETLEARLAAVQVAISEANLRQQQAEARLDPAVGIGVRRLQGTRDEAFVAGFSVPLPIRNRNQGSIEAARAEIVAAEAQLRGALATAGVRIGNAKANLAAAQARVEAMEQAGIPEAREAVRLAQVAYRAGKIQLVELLDAQSALATAQNELIEAHLSEAQAAAELARATAQ